MKATTLKTLTLISAVATLALASAAHAADKLPDFASKVQLWNCGGAEPTTDGKGVMLYRAPKDVRDQLDTKTPDGKERSGATQMRAAVHSEIRFALNQGVKHSDVKLHLKTGKARVWSSSGGMSSRVKSSCHRVKTPSRSRRSDTACCSP